MNNFWNIAIKPILDAVKPEVIVEIGVFSGINTKNILESCDNIVIVHAVDPAPMENVYRLLDDHADRFVLHRDASLNVIPKLPEFQVGLIDGDHNWFTVYHELQLISELHDGNARQFPVLLFHDIAWPYGRRDLYYEPARIPDEFRHEFAQKGIRWGESELVDDGGLNRQLMHAVREGGAKNGVLTAIEDFVETSSIEFDFFRVTAYFGFGILVSKTRKAACPSLSRVLDELTSASGLMRMIETLEEIRAKAHIREQELGYELKRLQMRQPNESKRDLDTVGKVLASDSSHLIPTLSVIVVVFNMRREAQRTLHSLTREYQQGIEGLNYEIIVIDNGSDDPLGEEYVHEFGENFSYLYLENATVSPAHAINVGAGRAKGEVLAVMIDGAHVLTPRVLHYATKAFQNYPNPVVAPRYWFIGPGQQGETVSNGYNEDVEDRLFRLIDWPSNGYRLFEIGEFIGPNSNWLTGFFESNCLFMRRQVFEAIGGANESFDFPGGGFLNLDILREASEYEGVELVTFLGEATFHQVHGGVTTNVPPELREERVTMYRKQYREIRGREYQVPERPIEYLGHRPDIRRERLAFKGK